MGAGFLYLGLGFLPDDEAVEFDSAGSDDDSGGWGMMGVPAINMTFALTDDAPAVNVINIDPWGAEHLYDPDLREAFLGQMLHETQPGYVWSERDGTLSVSQAMGRSDPSDERQMTVEVAAGRSGSTRAPSSREELDAADMCMVDDLFLGDAARSVEIFVPAGICGLTNSFVHVRIGPDGVEVADTRLFLAGRLASERGTVGIDRLGARGNESGDRLPVDLTPVALPEAQHWGQDPWPPARRLVCFEVTVHAGDAGEEGQVVPVVELFADGDAVPIPDAPRRGPRHPDDPNLPAIYRPRVVAQPADTVYVWSFGPIPLDEVQPDEITVSASEGEIESWDASARTC